MTTVTLEGEPLHVGGHFPQTGETAHSFMLVNKDLTDVSLSEFAGKRKVLSIVPSIDTPVCATSTRVFNQRASEMPNTVVLVISADLPFAQNRFCAVEGLSDVVTLSTMRGRDFHKDYGVMIMDPPLAGLLARAVVILDENDRVIYSELVPEIKQEPNYEAAIEALQAHGA